MGGVGHGKRPGQGQLFGCQHAGCLVQLQSAVLLRGVDHQQAQLAALFHQLDRQRQVVVFDLLAVRDHLVQDELLGRIADLALLIAEILRCEDVVLVGCGDQVFGTFE